MTSNFFLLSRDRDLVSRDRDLLSGDRDLASRDSKSRSRLTKKKFDVIYGLPYMGIFLCKMYLIDVLIVCTTT